jgi:subtilisin family serine protease/outer membrane protein assembly factor BamB
MRRACVPLVSARHAHIVDSLKPKFLVLLFLGAIAMAAAAPDEAGADLTAKERAQGFREQFVLAKPHPARRAAAESEESREGLRIHRRWERFGGLRQLRVPAGASVADTIARLEASGRYEYVQRDYLIHASVTPNDPSFARQWPLANDGSNNGIVGADIKAPSAWEVRTDAPNVIVAVIDSGVKLDHPDLAANLWRNAREIPGNGIDDDGDGYVDDVNGINAIANNGNPMDDLGHGTHVAGIIGAVGNNGVGISGVAWRVQLMALKFLRAGDGTGTTADAIECIDYAIAHGANIINASWGADASPVTSFDPAQRDAIARARDAGIIFVAAAGNDGANLDLLAKYPASHRLENIVAVANSTARDDASIDSNFGSGSVELFAPGSEVYSTWYAADSLYESHSGTSMAAPHVSGALALLKAQFPGDSYRQLINRLLRSVDPVTALAGKVQTGGRLNLDRALRSTDSRPFNDDFASRARLRGANLALRTVNTGATVEAEPAIGGQAGSASLWWEWTAPTTGTVRLTTAGSSYDTLVGVFTGSTLDALTPVASNDDEDTGKTTSRLEFAAQAGTTYQIAVASKGGGTGLTLMELGAIPANDNFAGAEILTGRSALVEGANAQATLEPGEPQIQNRTGGKSLWYRWTAPASGRFQVAVISQGFDPLLAVYTGSSLAALTLVGANDNADAATGGTTPNTMALVPLDAVAGTTYQIQVDGRAVGGQPPINATFTLTLNDARWQAVTNGSVTSAPTVGPDGAVYVGSTDGFFHAFNADGTRRWAPLDFKKAALDTSAAALAPDGTLYVGTGPTEAGRDAKLRAIDSATGTSRWEIVVGPGQNANNAVALAADGTIYVHSDAGQLHAFTDLGSSAEQKWVVSLPGNSYASAVIGGDGTIYLGSDEPAATGGAAARHRFYAITPEGTIKWTFATDNAVYTAAALDAAGNIYFGTLTSGRLYSLTPGGTPRWIYTGARNGTSSSPALSPDGSSVYFAGYDGVLHAVNTATGTGRWTYRLGEQVRASSPAVDANGIIYVGCYDNFLYAVNPDGTLRRTWATGNIVRSSPALAGTALMVGSNDGCIYAFDAGAGPAGPWPQYRNNAARTGRMAVAPPTITAAPASRAAVAGDNLELTVAATAAGPLSYQWFKDGSPVAGATAATLTLPAVGASAAGNYTAAVSSAQGSAQTAPAAVTVRGAGETAAPGRVTNLSVRASAGSGDQTLIVGFYVAGEGPKPVLIRAIGPSLAQFGETGTLGDPRLQLLSAATVLETNDNWGAPANGVTAAALSAAFAAMGAFPLPAGSLDAAMLRTVGPGPYTAQISAATGSGVALAELYEDGPAVGSRLANVSVRSPVSAGSELIAGFSISGNMPTTVLIRGAGPSLNTLGVTGVLGDPRLTLYRNSVALAENDDWGATAAPGGAVTLADAFRAVGAFPFSSTGSRDAAMLVTLTPGNYTAQVSAANRSSGVALIEVYQLP